MSRAEEQIRRFETRSPLAVRLAEAVSLAVIADPPLLRKARLELVPDADPGTEADLWLSPLVQTRSPDGIVFSAETAEALRIRLASDADRLTKAWETMQEVHSHLTPALRLEEEIAWLSLAPASDTRASERIEKLLRSALAALVVGERRGLAHWAARALPKLPVGVRWSEAARMLEAGAHLRLHGDARPLSGDEKSPDWLSWVAPADLPRVPVAVRLFEGAVELDARPNAEGQQIQLPQTDPLLVELSWREPGGKKAVQVTFRKEKPERTPVPVQDVCLRTVLGEVYDLRKAGTVPRGLRDWIIDFSEERARHRPFFGREEELRELISLIHQPLTSAIAVVGEMGSGKTAFLAALIDRLETTTGFLPPHHFFRHGETRTEDLRAAERSLTAQVMSYFEGLPAHMAALPLAELLGSLSDQHLLAARENPLILVIDAIDQSVEPDGKPGSLDRIFSLDIPPGVVVITSSRLFSVAVAVTSEFVLGEPSVAVYEYWHGQASSLQSEIYSDLILRACEISEVSFHLADVLYTWLHDHRPAIRSLEAVGAGAEGFFGRLLEQAASEVDPEALAIGLGMLAAAREPLPRFVTQRVLREKVGELAAAVSPLLAPRESPGWPFALRNDTVRHYLVQRLGEERIVESHRRLAEIVAPLPWEGARFPADVRAYGLRHGVEHHLGAGDPGSASQLATSFAFLIDQIRTFGPETAIRSLRLWLSETEHEPEYPERRRVEAFHLGLLKSVPLLLREPEALASMLYISLRTEGLRPSDIRELFQLPPGEPPLRLAEWFPSNGLPHRPIGRHYDEVIGCTFVDVDSPTILSWSTDGTLRVWNETTGDLQALLIGHKAEVTGCVPLVKSRAVSSSRDGSLRLWDIRDGTLIRTFWGHEGEVLGILSLDSDKVISWSADRTIRIWNLDSGEELVVLRGHDGAVTVCAANGRHIVSGSADTTVRVWESSSGALLSTFRGHTDQVTGVALLSGEKFISVSLDRSVRIGTLEETGQGEKPAVFLGHKLGILGCAVEEYGLGFATWSDDQTIRIWSFPSLWDERAPLSLAQTTATLEGHEGAVLSCAFFPGGNLVSCSSDRTVRIWNTEASKPIRTLQGHAGPVRAIALRTRPAQDRLGLPSIEQIVSASADRTLRVWNAKTDEETILDGESETLLCLPFRDRRQVATVSRFGEVHVYDVGSSTPPGVYGISSMVVGGGIVTPDEQRLVLWSQELITGQVRFAVLEFAPMADQPFEFGGHEGPVLACAMTPDSRMLLTASMDESVGLWSLKTGSLVKSIYLGSPVSDIQVSSDGRFAVAACWDGTLRHLDLFSDVGTVLAGHTDRVLACAIGPESLRRVSASADHTLRYWELESSNTFAVLTGHTAEVTGCVFTRDGKRIVSCSKDGRVGLWAARTGALVAFAEGHTDWVNAIALGDDDGVVYSCSEDQTVRAWDLATGEPRGVVYGVSAFRSLAAVAGGVYAGDEAGNLWILEFGEGLRGDLA